MNTTMWKYEVENFMQLPEGFKILSVQWQHDKLVLWAAVDPGVKAVTVEVLQVETGQRFEAMDKYKFLGTFQRHNGEFVFHVFYREP